jgi:hypothetical protein
MAFSISVLRLALPDTPGYGNALTSQAAQPKLVNLAQGIRVLPVILDDIDVVRGGQDARKRGSV